MDQAAMTGGFADPPIQSAWGFRAAMTAMARPGDILAVSGAQAPAPLSVAASVLLLVLCDPDTPVWLAPSHDSTDLQRWIAFHTGASVVAVRRALAEAGRLQDAWLIERGTMPGQRIARLAEVDAADCPYFAIVLVHGQGRRPVMGGPE